jgi:uncharacterized protein YggL (DUF469 family)
MNPFEYRKRILAEHEEANDRAVQELIDEVTQDAQITMKGTIYGPYVNHSTYYLSTGKKCRNRRTRFFALGWLGYYWRTR